MSNHENEEMAQEAVTANKTIKDLETEYELAYKTILEAIIKQYQEEYNQPKLRQLCMDLDLTNNSFIWDLTQIINDIITP